MIASILFGFLPLLIWLYLLLGHRFFWLLRERDTSPVSVPEHWPSVVAIVPARNEEDVIEENLTSLLVQDYPGELRVILVDDQSEDRTSEIAHAIGDSRLTILKGDQRSTGWTGKLWAMSQGVAEAGTPEFFWFTDADIAHSPDNLRQLVARAQAGKKTLVSLMARLHCRSTAEHFLIPAFVFFFDMLFPFGGVNDAKSEVAAAAGGCMLARREVLNAAGGMASIRTALIDDCALAKILKGHGPIWIGLTDRVHSIRAYPAIGDIRRMVSRTAYAQLRYSPLLLAGTVLGLAVTYLAPVALTLFAGGVAQFLGLFTWLLMAFAFRPTLRFYGLSSLWGLALPVIAAIYVAFTLDSAYQHARGRGGMWKGRAQANVSDASVSDANVSELR
jgi:hopene-associated glycosyltransferase HpnB